MDNLKQIKSAIDKLKKKIAEKTEKKSKQSSISKNVDKLLKSKVTFRGIKKSPRATVVVDQPVYEEDRSRFFKAQFDRDRRQLYFK